MAFNFPETERKILKFWEKNKIFEKSIKQRRGKPFYSFYDGPPFATGKPHYGHILATTIKDTVLRYWTMRGYYIPRRVGWDCHGLPVENLIEKELGLKDKKEIEEMGIKKFNDACRASVFRCVGDFQKTLKRVGRWADYKNAYATLDNDYIESVWWVFKKLWDEGLVYKDYRVTPYCPRCGTPLSNFEVNQGYKETKEKSFYLKFKIKDERFKKAYFLVWTTTPWTLPANLALAVNPQAEYIEVKEGGENLILAEKRKAVLKGKYRLIKRFKGKEIIGTRYEPLFDYILKEKPKNIERAFQIFPADFVTLEEGSGIVHIAPMYGEDDFNLGQRENLPFFHIVDQNGRFCQEVREFAGFFVKKADSLIIDNLKKRNLFYQEEEIVHNYPFCWRCDTLLLYYALETWYIRVAQFKKRLIENNKKIRWVPAHIKKGRFGKWLEGAKDWSFSRKRFWGAPIPIWQCEKCGSYEAIGNVEELGRKMKDLHRPMIDKVFLKCEKCGSKMQRIEDVFDCWFESGSMPYAQWHYPFENKKLVEKTFPADFIAEGLDQTRGWFYTLHVLAGALTLKNIGLGKNRPAFKNVVVNGIILAEDGQKLSKRLKNYPDLSLIFDKYGADSLRYFLLASTPIGEDYRISEKAIAVVWRNIVATFWNCFIFFQTYRQKNFKPRNNFKTNNLLDKWILSRLNRLNQEVIQWMKIYDLTKASRLFGDFIEDLSNWYVRRSRRRFQKPANQKEKEEAGQTLYRILKKTAVLMAPFLPFISEEVYRTLAIGEDKESVHLLDFPKPNLKLIDKKLEKKMLRAREIVSQVLAQRVKAGIKVRQPLNELRIKNYELKGEEELLELIKEEVNVKEIIFDSKIKKEVELDTNITLGLKKEGALREVVHCVQTMRKKMGLKSADKIAIQYKGGFWLNKILAVEKNFILKELEAENFQPKKGNDFDAEKEIKIDGEKLWIGIKKA
jgi:isoleucyl-tRNA synthetase